MSFLDFLYKVPLESPNIFFGWFRQIFSDLATLSLARSPPLKLASLALKTASIENLWEVYLKQRLVGLSQLHPTLPKRLLGATYILATYNEVAYEQQTHVRSSLLYIFRRESSDDRKCVCCSQANNKVTPKTKNRPSAENSLKIEFHGISP